MSNVSCSAVIVAAGRGKRMGAEKNKALLPLSGKPVIWWTLQGFISHPIQFKPIILVVAGDDVAYMNGLIEGNGWASKVKVVEGGEERVDSVRNGLAVLTAEKCEWVAVHDGARPLFTPTLLSKCIQKAVCDGSAVAAVPVKDTIKKAEPDSKVIVTPERAGLFAVQTPQVFRFQELMNAYAALDELNRQDQKMLPTDDAMVMEMAGYPVYLAEGEYENIKLTTPEDMSWAETILRRRQKPGNDSWKDEPTIALFALRTGFGYDVHRLVENRPLVLGGVEIPYEKGLLGHSDADVLLHAIKDALLGAAGLGDIGKHFPDSDPAYKGISSLRLLNHVVDLLHDKGFRIVNIDATIVAQRPKLAPYISHMNRNIGDTLGIEIERVNVKATTTEGLGFTGNGEGIAAYAVATIVNATLAEGAFQ